MPDNESARLEALRRYGVLDTPPDETFNRLTRLASSYLAAPIALITLVDGSRQWCASSVGLDLGSTPRDHGFGAYTILADDVLVVPDTTADARFLDNPLVTGDPAIRFYAGAPLLTPDRFRIGSLCVLDRAVRSGACTAVQRQHLSDLAALVVDHLELRRSTAALEESEQRYRLLFQGNPQPMWVYDLDTYAFLDVNAAAEAMYGYTRQEFLSLTILDIRPNEDTERVRGAVTSRSGGVARTGPWRHVRKDGSLVFVRISAYPTRFEGRRARLVLSHDISTEKHLEEQLVQAQKMEAIGQLAGGVAHDFNNLLTVINGYAQLLTSGLHETDPLRVDAGHVLQAGERAAALTQQLLAFSRRQVLQPRPVDVGRVIDNIRPMLGRLLRGDIEVHMALPSTLPPVMVDPVQFEQVLLNLAINGSDAMPAGGTLRVHAREVSVDADTADLHDVTEGPYVTVSVSDTGIGMDEETRGRIFEPFFTTKAKGRGSGLGLPVAYGIIKQSGGNIVVTTAPGEGATFTVYLPLAEVTAAVEDPSRPPNEPPVGGPETVLVVEDHAAVRRLAADVLRAHGYQVLVADNGLEAIAMAKARGGEIDLLLTDVIMPRMSGREVATALQQYVPNVSVLFMSGYTQTASVQHGALESGLHFLAKPFTPSELLARVREVLGARAAGNGHVAVAHTPRAVAVIAPRRIVVADDESGLRLLLAMTLTGAGYEVLQARDGLEAVRLCERDAVDLLLTDLVMPDHEGIETIRRMRQERPDIPVVAMSGAFDGGFLEVARAMGAAAVIQKPFTPEQVLTVITRVFDEHGGQRGRRLRTKDGGRYEGRGRRD